jgi:hypothetical protein
MHKGLHALLRSHLNDISSHLPDEDHHGELSFTYATWRGFIEQYARGLPTTVDVHARGCWLLTFAAQRGYPTIHLKVTAANIDKRFNAHRLMYKLFNHGAELPQGDRSKQVSHLCGKSLCVNPAHLVLESDAANKDRRGCKYGALNLCPHLPKCFFQSG